MSRRKELEDALRAEERIEANLSAHIESLSDENKQLRQRAETAEEALREIATSGSPAEDLAAIAADYFSQKETKPRTDHAWTWYTPKSAQKETKP